MKPNIMPHDMYFPAPPNMVPEALPCGAMKQRAIKLQNAYKAAGVRPDIANTLGWDSVFLMIDALKK